MDKNKWTNNMKLMIDITIFCHNYIYIHIFIFYY